MYDIVKAKYIKDYLIELHFADESKGVVDFSIYKNKPGLFKDLNDLTYFQKFYLDEELNTIAWENGLDIAPDTLYIKATGRIPDGIIE